MKKFLTLICVLIAALAKAQPFAGDIAAFRISDSLSFPFKGQAPIVFTGSSSFRKWESVNKNIPGYPIINRGFGGSTLPDVIRYADDLIFKYHPKQIVIYCGENDLAASDDVTADTVLQRFTTLYHMIREHLPKAHILFVAIKPSPSRMHIQPQVIRANMLIKNLLATDKLTDFADVYTPMLNADGSMRRELFVADDLHMNEKGYALWMSIIKPYLIK